MFQAFVITLREGLEAFLIVAIVVAYLRKMGRGDLISAVRWGIAASILLSVVAAMAMQRVANQALWEGTLALAAMAAAIAFSTQIWGSGTHVDRNIDRDVSPFAGRGWRFGYLGMFCLALLMITREGMETVLLLNALVFQIGAPEMVATACAGMLIAAGLAWLWARYGPQLPRSLLLQVTAIFLLLFVLQLAIYGFHELTEANLFPNSELLHWATEPYGPDGRFGKHFSGLLVAVPLAWLAIQSWRRARALKVVCS
ncbi:MAG: hypothetical protein GEU82_06405 [Luteitalea sp.]|nr:hypothetical protein [Luteitalea sp.]